MSKVETISDTDSNTSSSWIFFNDPSEDQPEKNKYYLNCDSEPIQELNAANVEQETDSDGISIISESDDMKDCEVKATEVVKDALTQTVEPEKKIDYISIHNLIILSCVIVAATMPLLFNYHSTHDDNDLMQPDIYDVDLSNFDIKGAMQMAIKQLEKLEKRNLNKKLNKKARVVDTKGEIDQPRFEYDVDILIKDLLEDDFEVKQKKNKKHKNDLPKKSKEKDIFIEMHKKEIKKLKKLLEQKDNDIRDLMRLLRRKDKHLKILENEILKREGILTLKTTGGKKLNTTLNDWYYKMHEGRNKIREDQRAADWVFDRASFRNKKRNSRNDWYWNWMNEREQIRVKKGFWQFTY